NPSRALGRVLASDLVTIELLGEVVEVGIWKVDLENLGENILILGCRLDGCPARGGFTQTIVVFGLESGQECANSALRGAHVSRPIIDFIRRGTSPASPASPGLLLAAHSVFHLLLHLLHARHHLAGILHLALHLRHHATPRPHPATAGAGSRSSAPRHHRTHSSSTGRVRRPRSTSRWRSAAWR